MKISTTTTDHGFILDAWREGAVQIVLARPLDTPTRFVLRTGPMATSRAAHVADFLRGIIEPGDGIRTVLIRDIPLSATESRVTINAFSERDNLWRYRRSDLPGQDLNEILRSTDLSHIWEDRSRLLIKPPAEDDHIGRATFASLTHPRAMGLEPSLLAARRADYDETERGLVVTLPDRLAVSSCPSIPAAYHVVYDILHRDRAIPCADRALFNADVILAGSALVGIVPTHDMNANAVLKTVANAAGDVGVPESERMNVAHALLLDAYVRHTQNWFPDVNHMTTMDQVSRSAKIGNLLAMGEAVTKGAVMEAGKRWVQSTLDGRRKISNPAGPSDDF